MSASESGSKRRILIADDHAIVRQGLKYILQERPNIFCVTEADSAHQTLDLIQKKEFDLVILDISLPDGNGLEILKQIHEWKPGLPVLVMSIHAEEQFALRSLKAGAHGYVAKGSSSSEILNAIEKVMDGGRYLSADIADHFAFELGKDKWMKPSHENLSDREMEVLCYIVSGKSISNIAEKLHLSVKTVSTYRSRILEKMNMKSTAEMIRYGVQNNLEV